MQGNKGGKDLSKSMASGTAVNKLGVTGSKKERGSTPEANQRSKFPLVDTSMGGDQVFLGKSLNVSSMGLGGDLADSSRKTLQIPSSLDIDDKPYS